MEVSEASHHSWNDNWICVSNIKRLIYFSCNSRNIDIFVRITMPCMFFYSSLVARALIENPNLIRWSLLLKAFSGLVALLCGNGYIVGINQIYDVGIDK